MSDDAFQTVKANAPAGITIVRHIPNMVSALQSAWVSVSHSGYNTVGDILRAGCSSVLYPYVGGNETEQFRRAEMMDRLGIAKMVHPDGFSPETLAVAIDAAAKFKPGSVALDMNGAEKTAIILKTALKT